MERRLQEVTLWLRDASDKLNQRLDARLQATEGHILARFSDLEGRIDSLDAKLEGRFGNADTRLDNAATIPLQVWILAISIAALVLGLLGKLSLSRAVRCNQMSPVRRQQPPWPVGGVFAHPSPGRAVPVATSGQRVVSCRVVAVAAPVGPTVPARMLQ